MLGRLFLQSCGGWPAVGRRRLAAVIFARPVRLENNGPLERAAGARNFHCKPRAARAFSNHDFGHLLSHQGFSLHALRIVADQSEGRTSKLAVCAIAYHPPAFLISGLEVRASVSHSVIASTYISRARQSILVRTVAHLFASV